ncbi:DNA-binding transcriptional regulator, PadR family [Quadrisphaera granulorum]|uniref:DNA-binding PadR family transcriptional regulator n=2 Tax=Quadrisphaera granulorum TaxID=317664 RepID=A0A316A6J7_9ACTN|nr:DNA-binding PadR family transcriptional regulator [Quadrisphaera granulorum]SZE96843.1 DNA-binding transcriptional regulator, PadR family [Quadrisphaera granulorum]
MVLGVIAHRQPIGGYGVEAVLREWAVERWTTIAPASIYQQLKTLESAGSIHRTSGDGSRAALFTCTDDGWEELRRLCRSLLDDDVRPLGLVPLLHFTPVLPTAELVAGLERRINHIDAALAHEEDVLALAGSRGPAHVVEIFRLTVHALRAERTWSQEFIGRLRAGERAGS